MKTFDIGLAPNFDQLLARRERELCAVLSAREDGLGEEAVTRGVTDFKETASEQSRAVVDEAQAEHAAHELEQVLVARRRLLDRRYGSCMDCGDPIDLRRLSAMPSTLYCTSCQQMHEQVGAMSPVRRH